DNWDLPAGTYVYDLNSVAANDSNDVVTLYTGNFKIKSNVMNAWDGVNLPDSGRSWFVLSEGNHHEDFAVYDSVQGHWVAISKDSMQKLLDFDSLAVYEKLSDFEVRIQNDSTQSKNERDSLFTYQDTVKNNLAYRWFVDSENGNDSNNGKTPETAFKNLTKIQSLYDDGYLPEFSTIYLLTGSVWNQSLALGDNYCVSNYGEGQKPIVSGADTLAGFVNHSERIYKVTDFKATNDYMVINLYENGEGLKRVTSLSGMPKGTFAVYNQNTSSFLTALEIVTDTSHRFTLYVTASDSSNILTNNKTYEATKRAAVIHLRKYSSIIGIHGTKNGGRDGSLVVGRFSKIENCIVSWGNKHNALIGSGEVRKTIFLWNENPNSPGGSAQFVASDPEPLEDNVLVIDCEFYVKEDDTNTNPAYVHSSGAGYYYNTISFEKNLFVGGAGAIGVNEVKKLYAIENTMINSPGIAAYNDMTEEVQVIGNNQITKGTGGLVVTSADAYIYDNKVCFENGSNNGVVKVIGTGRNVEIKNNIFYKLTNQSPSFGMVIYNNRANNTFQIKNNIFWNWGWIILDSISVNNVQADSNIYSGNPYQFAQITVGGNALISPYNVFTSLQEVQDSTTWDDSSFTASPGFLSSPLYDHWEFNGSEAIRIEAGNFSNSYAIQNKRRGLIR
ncbi:MAG: hypothetical protein IT281_09365, partial [Ignavibacteria bacterium]|nr:hypothetical protein [Ignavibacteria bacterium]